MKRKSLARKSVSRKSVARKSVSRKSLTRKSITRKKSLSRKGSKASIGSRGSRKNTGLFTEYTAESITPLLKRIPDGESPIDIIMPLVTKAKLAPLVWTNLDSKPLSLIITNTTHSVVITGDWPEGSWPSVTGGPLESEYLFSQLHFHWGTEDTEGSEHSVNGSKFPVEGHIVFFKKDYKTHNEARNEVDGVIIFVNFYEIRELLQGDLSTAYVSKHLPEIRKPYYQKSLELVPVTSFMDPIIDDYLLYFGVMKYKCTHGILWFISRKPLPITPQELGEFRKVQQTARELVAPNYRELKDPLDRNVFMVNPTRNFNSVMFQSAAKERKQSSHPTDKGSRKSMKRQSVKRKSMKRQSVKRQSVKRQSVKRKSMKRQSMKKQK